MHYNQLSNIPKPTNQPIFAFTFEFAFGFRFLFGIYDKG